MKKRIMMLLLFLGFFVVGFSNVKAEDVNIDIVCGSTWCPTSDFLLIRLDESNTSGVGAAYGEYAEYFQSYYQSEDSCVKTSDGCVVLNDTYGFNMTWSSSIGFSAYPSNRFNNLTEAVGTAASYTKAGTYAYILKQTSVSTGVDHDHTEYVIYVNVKSDLTIGTVSARKIKDAAGNKITADKVTEITYAPNEVYPTEIFDVENVAFYLLNNKYSGTYADNTKKVEYYLGIEGKTTPVCGTVYDENGCVMEGNTCKKVCVNKYGTRDILFLEGGQALVFTNDVLDIGDIVRVDVYEGLEDSGYTLVNEVVKGDGKDLDTSSTVTFNLGGNGVNYAEYQWDYPESNVPDTGVAMKVLPYIIIAVLVVVVIVLLILTRRKKEIEKKEK